MTTSLRNQTRIRSSRCCH